MLKSIFTKTLFEKRWMILWWSVALFVLNAALIQIFPPMKEAFSSMTANLPDSLSVWFGENGQIWESVKGYVSLEVLGQMAAVMVVFGIIFSAQIFSGEEKSGLILTQLARPVRRWSYFAQKYLALVAATVIVLIFFLLGTSLGTLLVGDLITPLELLPGVVGVLLLVLSLSSIAFAISAATGSGAGSALVGVYAILGYFIVSLRGAADILTTLSQLTPFYYYNNPNLMYESFDVKHVLILLGFIVIPLVIALPIFAKRDLKTR
jgi:ABC-type transport system involved in multi-copper enzyme maturation permease subunit